MDDLGQVTSSKWKIYLKQTEVSSPYCYWLGSSEDCEPALVIDIFIVSLLGISKWLLQHLAYLRGLFCGSGGGTVWINKVILSENFEGE